MASQEQNQGTKAEGKSRTWMYTVYTLYIYMYIYMCAVYRSTYSVSYLDKCILYTLRLIGFHVVAENYD